MGIRTANKQAGKEEGKGVTEQIHAGIRQLKRKDEVGGCLCN